eukprot:4108329-Pleurochrysis_carterae.AAC.5
MDGSCDVASRRLLSMYSNTYVRMMKKIRISWSHNNMLNSIVPDADCAIINSSLHDNLSSSARRNPESALAFRARFIINLQLARRLFAISARQHVQSPRTGQGNRHLLKK